MPVKYCEAASSAYSYPLLIRHILQWGAANAPRQTVVHGAGRLSYANVAERVGRLGAVLARLGVEEGSTVAVMDWDSHRYLECFFAIPMLGAVLMTVNVRLSAEQILYTLGHSAAEVLMLHEDFAALLPQIVNAAPKLRHIIWVSDGDPSMPAVKQVVGEYEALLGAMPLSHPWVEFDENAMAVLFYTTGTTGLPKAVAFSHRQIVLKVLVTYGAWAAQAPGQSFRQGDVYMPITPMFHVQAWSFPYAAWLLGVKQVYPGRYEPRKLLRLRKEEGVSFSHCVPTLLDMLLRAPQAADTDLTGWKICVGGASLTAGLAQAALDRGIDVFAAYGLSETYAGTLLTGFRGQRSEGGGQEELSIRCKAGRPLPLVEVRVVDDQLHEVPHDDRSVGEIVVRMPWAVQAYEGMPEASEQLWQGGYLHTQDLARWDAEGYITLVDRLKDVIKSGGEWVSSLELESLLTRHDEVAEAAVIPIADSRWGERPLALIVPRHSNAEGLTERLHSYLSSLARVGSISRYAIPARIDLVAQLARTSVGKIDKKALRERYAVPGSSS